MYPNHPDFNLHTIFPIIKLSTILHILPFCAPCGTPKSLKYNRIISVLVTVTILSFLLYVVILDRDYVGHSSKIVNFLTRFKGILIVASNLHGFTAGNLLNTEKYSKLLGLTQLCYSRFNRGKPNSSKGFRLIVFYNVFVVCGKGCCAAYWIVHDKISTPLTYFFFVNGISYFFYINILFLWGFIYFVLGCLRAFKFELRLWMDGGRKGKAGEICANFLGICEIVELFNDVFGLQIFVTVIFIIVDLLICLDLFIVNGMDQFQSDIVLLFWTCILIILGIILVHYSEKVKNELSSVYSVCYECVYRFRGEVGEEFASLAEQIATRRPAISAGGFFNLDHGMLFTLCNLIVSYLVVVVQLGNTL